MDHNKVDEKQIFLNKYVSEIIDHHADSETNNTYKNLKKKSLIYPLGSCSSLVLLENFRYLEEILIDEKTKKFEAENFFRNSFKDFLIFISPVLIDTRNFSEDDYNVRWNNLDLLAYNKIITLNEKFYSKINEETNKTKEISGTKLYENLINSKYDPEANLNLGLKKLLIKDKKEFNYYNYHNNNNTSVIWSSLQLPLDCLINKFGLENLKKEINEALGNKNLYVINYRQKEDINYTLVAIFINERNENSNFFELNKFCENIKKFLTNEMKDEYFNAEIIKDCFCLIKLHQNITRKNFEPILNKYFK